MKPNTTMQTVRVQQHQLRDTSLEYQTVQSYDHKAQHNHADSTCTTTLYSYNTSLEYQTDSLTSEAQHNQTVRVLYTVILYLSTRY